MQTTTYFNYIKENSLILGLLHSTLLPGICILAFSWYGLFYLLIPTGVYLTFKKEGIGRDWFFTILFIYVIALLAGLVDYSTVGGN
jgi:hypothetical protein